MLKKLDCLDNLVGLKDCSLKTPTSGLYVNDLPGMSTELLDKLADRERLTYAGVWDRVRSRAKVRFLASMRQRFTASHKWKEVLYQSPAPRFTKAPLTPPPAGTLRGVQIGALSGPYALIKLKAVYLHAAAPAEATLRLFSLETGEELLLDPAPEPMELTRGRNKIALNLELPSIDRSAGYFIAFDGVEVALMEHDEESFDPDGEVEYLPAAYELLEPSQEQEPAELDLGTFAPSVSGWGMALDFVVTCSAEAVLCNNSDAFVYAWLNLLGAEILTEKINSPRVNWATSGDRELTDENIALFETEYRNALSGAVKGLPKSELCLECATPRPYPGTYMMP